MRGEWMASYVSSESSTYLSWLSIKADQLMDNNYE